MIDDDRGPETEYDEKRKRVKKYTCCVTVFVLISMLLIISGSFVPKLFDTLISAGAKKSAQLSQENEADWRNIPGTHDIGIYWNQYFYNCTNAEAVVYTNAQPEYQEFGPYIYREFDNYNDLNYTNLDNMIS